MVDFQKYVFNSLLKKTGLFGELKSSVDKKASELLNLNEGQKNYFKTTAFQELHPAAISLDNSCKNLYKCYISLLHVILCERRNIVSERGNDTFLRIDLTSDTRHIIVNEILWRASVNTKSLIIEFISTFGTISSYKRTCGAFTGARITVDQILCQETSIRASIIATVLEVVNMC